MGLLWPRTVYSTALKVGQGFQMSLITPDSCCLPMKSSHNTFVALQAAVGMRVLDPRTLHCSEGWSRLANAPAHPRFLLLPIKSSRDTFVALHVTAGWDHSGPERFALLP